MQLTNEVASASVVRQRYKSGCSVRLLHPQRFSAKLQQTLALLEDVYQCPMGCNAYLTPAASQVR